MLDGTGNLEILLPKVDALEELERRAHAVVATFGAGSWQGMVSAPRPAEVTTFDSEADYARLSPEVRRMLERVVPAAEKTELASMYSRYDRVAPSRARDVCT